MSFKDKMDEDGERFWKSAFEDRQIDVLGECVEKIDELETRLTTQNDKLSGLYAITDAHSRRLAAVEHPLIPPSTPEPVLSNRQMESIVATLKTLKENGVFDQSSNGDGNHG